MAGFIVLNRRVFEQELWLSEPFTRGQAWVDLIGLAAWADHEVNGRTILRGQLLTTMRWLADRWHWRLQKTVDFLDALEAEHKIASKRNTKRGVGGTLIFIINYDKYQSLQDWSDSPRNADSDKSGTQNVEKTVLSEPDNRKNHKQKLLKHKSADAEPNENLFDDETAQPLPEKQVITEQQPNKLTALEKAVFDHIASGEFGTISFQQLIVAKSHFVKKTGELSPFKLGALLWAMAQGKEKPTYYAIWVMNHPEAQRNSQFEVYQRKAHAIIKHHENEIQSEIEQLAATL